MLFFLLLLFLSPVSIISIAAYIVAVAFDARNFPSANLTQFVVGKDDFEREPRNPDGQGGVAEVVSVFGQDGDVGEPVSFGTVEVNVLARLRHFERIARLRMTRGLGGSA